MKKQPGSRLGPPPQPEQGVKWKMQAFVPDYRHIVQAATNQEPERLPLYEHLISPKIMEQVLNTEFAALIDGNESERLEFFRQYCRFFRRWDTTPYRLNAASVK